MDPTMSHPSANQDSSNGHNQFAQVLTRNSICDRCTRRNPDVMQKCMLCGLTTCRRCHERGSYDAQHNLAGADLNWERPAASATTGPRKGGAREKHKRQRRKALGLPAQQQHTPVAPASSPLSQQQHQHQHQQQHQQQHAATTSEPTGRGGNNYGYGAGFFAGAATPAAFLPPPLPPQATAPSFPGLPPQAPVSRSPYAGWTTDGQAVAIPSLRPHPYEPSILHQLEMAWHGAAPVIQHQRQWYGDDAALDMLEAAATLEQLCKGANGPLPMGVDAWFDAKRRERRRFQGGQGRLDWGGLY
ncbi:hypothetical protein BX600DRAFT_432421 [Xylariales sp. PMI_506]|nr:hypothetical protein BX600DRAFT_432421 [Xylariales sp. PMI_506]